MITAKRAAELWEKNDVPIPTKDLRRVEALIRHAIAVKEDRFVDVWVHPETIAKLEELEYRVVNGYGKLYRVYF